MKYHLKSNNISKFIISHIAPVKVFVFYHNNSKWKEKTPPDTMTFTVCVINYKSEQAVSVASSAMNI